MGDEDAQYKYVFKGGEEEEEEEKNWLSKPGTASVTYPNGDTFEGTFNAERVKEGEATYNWVTRDDEDEIKPLASFTGTYQTGKRNGTGTMQFPNGDRYTGDFKDGLMHGEGTYEYKNGDIYSGAFVENKKSGLGEYEFGEDRSKLVGTWENGSFTEGKWLFIDGSFYTGKFENGRPLGEGTFTFVSGITQTGTFVPEKKTEEEEEDEGAMLPKAMKWMGNSVVVV